MDGWWVPPPGRAHSANAVLPQARPHISRDGPGSGSLQPETPHEITSQPAKSMNSARMLSHNPFESLQPQVGPGSTTAAVAPSAHVGGTDTNPLSDSQGYRRSSVALSSASTCSSTPTAAIRGFEYPMVLKTRSRDVADSHSYSRGLGGSISGCSGYDGSSSHVESRPRGSLMSARERVNALLAPRDPTKLSHATSALEAIREQSRLRGQPPTPHSATGLGRRSTSRNASYFMHLLNKEPPAFLRASVGGTRSGGGSKPSSRCDTPVLSEAGAARLSLSSVNGALPGISRSSSTHNSSGAPAAAPAGGDVGEVRKGSNADPQAASHGHGERDRANTGEALTQVNSFTSQMSSSLGPPPPSNCDSTQVLSSPSHQKSVASLTDSLVARRRSSASQFLQSLDGARSASLMPSPSVPTLSSTRSYQQAQGPRAMAAAAALTEFSTATSDPFGSAGSRSNGPCQERSTSLRSNTAPPARSEEPCEGVYPREIPVVSANTEGAMENAVLASVEVSGTQLAQSVSGGGAAEHSAAQSSPLGDSDAGPVLAFGEISGRGTVDGQQLLSSPPMPVSESQVGPCGVVQPEADGTTACSAREEEEMQPFMPPVATHAPCTSEKPSAPESAAPRSLVCDRNPQNPLHVPQPSPVEEARTPLLTLVIPEESVQLPVAPEEELREPVLPPPQPPVVPQAAASRGHCSGPPPFPLMKSNPHTPVNEHHGGMTATRRLYASPFVPLGVSEDSPLPRIPQFGHGSTCASPMPSAAALSDSTTNSPTKLPPPPPQPARPDAPLPKAEAQPQLQPPQERSQPPLPMAPVGISNHRTRSHQTLSSNPFASSSADSGGPVTQPEVVDHCGSSLDAADTGSKTSDKALERSTCPPATCFAVFAANGRVIVAANPTKVLSTSEDGKGTLLLSHNISRALSASDPATGIKATPVGKQLMETTTCVPQACLTTVLGQGDVLRSLDSLKGALGLLKRLLSLMITTPDFDWSAGGQKQLVKILWEERERLKQEHGASASSHQIAAPMPATNPEEGMRMVQSLLALGDRNQAAECALHYKLYAHAILIGMMCDKKDYYIRAVQAVATESMSPHSPLAHAYFLFNELPIPSPNAALAECVDSSASGATCSDAPRISSDMPPKTSVDPLLWMEHVSVLVANFTRGSGDALVKWGDALLMQNQPEEAHCCYLLAQLSPMGTPPPHELQASSPRQLDFASMLRSRLISIGGHCSVMCGRSALLNATTVFLTEVYEYARRRRNKVLIHPPLLALRLMHAYTLTELGLSQTAKTYVDELCALLPPMGEGFRCTGLMVPRSLQEATAIAKHRLFGREPLQAVQLKSPPSTEPMPADQVQGAALNASINGPQAPLKPLAPPPGCSGSGEASARGTSVKPSGDSDPESADSNGFRKQMEADEVLGKDAPGEAGRGHGQSATSFSPGFSSAPKLQPGEPARSVLSPHVVGAERGPLPPPLTPLHMRERRSSKENDGPRSPTSVAGRDADIVAGVSGPPGLTTGGDNKEKALKPQPQRGRAAAALSPESKKEAAEKPRRSRSLEAITNFLFRRSKSQEPPLPEVKKMIIDTAPPPKFDPTTGQWMFEKTEEEKLLEAAVKAGPPKPVSMPTLQPTGEATANGFPPTANHRNEQSGPAPPPPSATMPPGPPAAAGAGRVPPPPKLGPGARARPRPQYADVFNT